MKNCPFGIQRPLTSVWVAAVLLNCDEHQIHRYIQDGQIPLAFDISHPGARRAAIRVALPNVMELRHKRKRTADLNEFLLRFFNDGIYRAVDVAWLLQCDYDFVYKLVRAKALENSAKAGRYLISRANLSAFLKKRRIN